MGRRRERSLSETLLKRSDRRRLSPYSSFLAPYDKGLVLYTIFYASFVASRPKAAPPTSRLGEPILEPPKA